MERRGRYTIHEIWAYRMVGDKSRRRYRITLDRACNLIQVQLFDYHKEKPAYLSYWHWKTIFHRAYKRKKPLTPVLVDVVLQAIEETHQ